jgi:predicted dehydrogenase
MVRIGVVGLGNMGSGHVQTLSHFPDVTVTVADEDASRLEKYPNLKGFSDPVAMMDSGEVDAVVIATPHFSHTSLGIEALRRGLHVLVEKPISVHKADALRLIGAWDGKVAFAAMFNQRTDPYYQAIHRMVGEGRLGEIVRTNWIITNWFRPDCYYASGGWRATWRGEGGGVLLNQSPHNLDLFQWICGMPTKVRAFCGFGKYHSIEVEDDVTAYLEYANGATGVFITGTGEAPGTNRLEIAGDLGKLVYEDGVITLIENEVGAREFSKTAQQPFSAPKTTSSQITFEGHGDQHKEILRNFVAAIETGEPLIAPAAEGIHSVELANAMLLSAWTDATVELPIDAPAYEEALHRMIAKSS